MSKKTRFASFLRHSWKIVPGIIAASLPFMSTEPSLLSKLAPSTPTATTPEKVEILITEIEGADIAQAQTAMPPAAYLSVQVKDDALQITEKSNGTIATHTPALQGRDAATALFDWLKEQGQRHQFIAASIEEDQFKDDFSRLWLQEDVVPFVLRPHDPAYHTSGEVQVREVAANFDEHSIVHIPIHTDREVEIAELVTLDDYRKTTTEKEFAQLTELAQALQGKRLIFINATPRGGGVALMRHALIRLFKLLHVDAHWYILIPQKDVFDITKTKFHNVLQAVASKDAELTAEEKALYEAWSKENAAALEDVFKQADVIVIDDPQPAGMIPYIKQANPDAKIIYRSHIQVVASLASQPGTPQHTTWSFLWDKIRLADYFVSHPMKMFIPDCVPAEKIFYMPATTDPLDGLNKPLTQAQMSTYMKLFNSLLQQEGQTPLDETREYIIQIARFDPSKGIPDLLDAYRKLRIRLQEEGKPIPQLVITGNGSIDDPDGVPIYNHVMQILQSDDYASFADDIKVVRLPHRDQLLNTLLRKSAVVLQLSIKEGFEVKVTEALMKGKPMVAYRVGGIPLQIEDGVTGYLVESGDTTQVAQHLYDLLTDQDLYQRMSRSAATYAGRDYLTIPNAICWLYLALKLIKGEKQEGHYQWVRALAHAHFSQEQ
ncbi:MAG TPA: glycosyltransferase [Ktedonobacteraceae bacterium]|nr:glycosyltransferase [Ktedonobacteraceae bacterium]